MISEIIQGVCNLTLRASTLTKRARVCIRVFVIYSRRSWTLAYRSRSRTRERGDESLLFDETDFSVVRLHRKTGLWKPCRSCARRVPIVLNNIIFRLDGCPEDRFAPVCISVLWTHRFDYDFYDTNHYKTFYTFELSELKTFLRLCMRIKIIKIIMYTWDGPGRFAQRNLSLYNVCIGILLCKQFFNTT